MGEIAHQKALFAFGARAFLRAFDYRGRSTRSEVSAYFLFTWAVQIAVLMAFLTFDHERWVEQAAGATVVLLLIPAWLALLVRRLHDQDLSGWWAALIYPTPFVALAATGLLPQGSGGGTATLLFWKFHPVGGLGSTLLSVAFILGLAAWGGFYLAKGKSGPNLYGPDPRQDRETQPVEASAAG